MDWDRLELIAARMRRMGEKTELLHSVERLRIVAHQRKKAISLGEFPAPSARIVEQRQSGVGATRNLSLHDIDSGVLCTE